MGNPSIKLRTSAAAPVQQKSLTKDLMPYTYTYAYLVFP